MMGLSIGVHLLNLLTIPAIVMVYYYKRYTPTAWGSVFAFFIGCVITGLIQKFVIQYTIKGAAWFDIQFVNNLSLPFFSGFAFFFIALTALLVYGIRYAIRKKYYLLKIGIWSISFMLLGYSTYFTTMIRSSADPAVDMFNVDNPVTLVGYLSRDQYGDWPIVYGPDFTDRPNRVEGSDQYIKGKDKYILAGKTVGQDWNSTPSSHFFPRMWITAMTAGSRMYIKAMAMWQKAISPPWGIISGILLLTKPTGCTSGIFSGIFRENKMTCRVLETSATVMPLREYLSSIIIFTATRANCPTAFITRTNLTTGCMPCPLFWE
jgi:hypothetical protein